MIKSLILTSSIFFILGLKMTHNIEPNQKMNTDTVHIVIPETKVLPAAGEQKNLLKEPKKQKEPAGSTLNSGENPIKP